MKKKIVAIRILSAVWIAFWMAVIIYNSSLNATRSASLSGKVLAFVKKIFIRGGGGSGSEDEGQSGPSGGFSLHAFIRKAAHFSEFFALGVGATCLLFTFRMPKKYYAGLIAFVFCVLFAISDESHQYFVDGRGMSFVDVLVDCGGVSVAIGFVYLAVYLFKKIRARRLKNQTK